MGMDAHSIKDLIVKLTKTKYAFVIYDPLSSTVIDVLDDGNRIIEFTCNGEFFSVLERVGQMPLPHYIKEKLEDLYENYKEKAIVIKPRTTNGGVGITVPLDRGLPYEELESSLARSYADVLVFDKASHKEMVEKLKAEVEKLENFIK